MNKTLLEIAAEANQGCKNFYESGWEYNCAAWTAAELEAFAEGIQNYLVSILLDVSGDLEETGKRAQSRLVLQLAEQLSDAFLETAEPQELET